jgi:hypothetical protein
MTTLFSSSDGRAPSLLAVIEGLGLQRTIDVLEPLSRLLLNAGSARSYSEVQEAMSFVLDNSAAHRVATLRFCAHTTEIQSQLDVSYIGYGTELYHSFVYQMNVLI